MRKSIRAEKAWELARLNAKYTEMMRGKMIPSPRALKIKRQAILLEDEIKRLDRDAAEQLALEKCPVDEVLEVIAIPLLADVINDVVAGVDGTLRRHGVQETVFGLYTAQIRQAALAMVDTLDQAESNLPRLLDVDDTLIDAIKKKLMSFIKRRLKIKG